MKRVNKLFVIAALAASTTAYAAQDAPRTPARPAVSARATVAQTPLSPGAACPICLVEFDATTDRLTTSCRHRFHESCLSRWLLANNTCPLCRAEVERLTPSRSPAPVQESFEFVVEGDSIDDVRAEVIRQVRARLHQDPASLAHMRFFNGNGTVLHLALELNFPVRLINQLLRNAAIRALVNQQNDLGETPLHVLCTFFPMRAQAAAMLLRAGADTTIRDNQGRTALATFDAFRARALLLGANNGVLTITRRVLGDGNVPPDLLVYAEEAGDRLLNEAESDRLIQAWEDEAACPCCSVM